MSSEVANVNYKEFQLGLRRLRTTLGATFLLNEDENIFFKTVP